MQLQTKENIKTNLDIEGAQRFKIKLNAKTFKILSNLYSDKIRAIIRELSCNAYDAHIAAGKSEDPIEVWLPTENEPYFKVKDKGLGLTEEDMYEIYTNVGESTKEDSNDQTGALGLGTKSPLYYADAFTVESIKDGFKKTYTCFLQDGFPTILKLPAMNEEKGEPYEDGAVPTDEENGVTVIVPTSDIQYFNESASEIYRPFSVKPIIRRSSSSYTELKYEVLEEGENWKELIFNYTTLVRYGNIEYPLNTDMLASFSYEERRFMEDGFVVDMPLGTLDIAPSREALSYDERTQENLLIVLRQVLEEYKGKIAPAIREVWGMELFLALQKIEEIHRGRKGIYSHRQFFKEAGVSELKKILSEIKEGDTPLDEDSPEYLKFNSLKRVLEGYGVNIRFSKRVVFYKKANTVIRTEEYQSFALRSILEGRFRLFHCSDENISIHKIRRLVREYIRQHRDVKYVAFTNNYKTLIPGLPEEYIKDVKDLSISFKKSTDSKSDTSRYVMYTKDNKGEELSFSDIKNMIENEESFYWMVFDEDVSPVIGDLDSLNSCLSYHTSACGNLSSLYALAIKTNLVKRQPLVYITKRESFLKRTSLIKDNGVNFKKEVESRLYRFALSHKKYMNMFNTVLKGVFSSSYFEGTSENTLFKIKNSTRVLKREDSIISRRIKVSLEKLEKSVKEVSVLATNLKENTKLNKDKLFTKLIYNIPVHVFEKVIGSSVSSKNSIPYLTNKSILKDVKELFYTYFPKSVVEVWEAQRTFSGSILPIHRVVHSVESAIEGVLKKGKINSREYTKIWKSLTRFVSSDEVMAYHVIFKKILKDKNII